jgi:agmatine deiminase
VEITKALVNFEKVYIICSGNHAKKKIIRALLAAEADTTNIRFHHIPTNDVWVRDNGPIFVFDTLNQLYLQDWGFNGWGKDFRWKKCDSVPSQIPFTPQLNLNAAMVLEGGAIEADGNGTILATKSALLTQVNPCKKIHAIRNPGLNQHSADSLIRTYLGARKIIWLDGILDPDDITDGHIDGFARFGLKNTLFTMHKEDLSYWGVNAKDQEILDNLDNISGQPYALIKLPLTANNVFNKNGVDLGFKGSYLNFYVANGVVLAPVYNDPNDQQAIQLLQQHFKDRKIVPIDCRNLIEFGGMVHCVTQQQPAKRN